MCTGGGGDDILTINVPKIVNFFMECDAMFDILKNPRKANRKAALYRWGSERDPQACEIKRSVGMSKVPLGTGLKIFSSQLTKFCHGSE